MNISKKDWKLFREKLLDWQEKYMENCQQNVSKNPENSKKHWNKQNYHTRYLFRRNGKPQYIGIRIEFEQEENSGKPCKQGLPGFDVSRM